MVKYPCDPLGVVVKKNDKEEREEKVEGIWKHSKKYVFKGERLDVVILNTGELYNFTISKIVFVLAFSAAHRHLQLVGNVTQWV